MGAIGAMEGLPVLPLEWGPVILSPFAIQEIGDLTRGNKEKDSTGRHLRRLLRRIRSYLGETHIESFAAKTPDK